MSQSSRATRANPVVIPGVELLEAVGQGARSLVYLGRRGERDFAVKIPRSAESEITSEVAREFHREAAVLARLKNPALPEVYEVGTSEEGLPYLIMEYVRGRTLAEELRKGPLSEEIIVRIASLLAQALEEVHRLGLVHRDLKPQNVILTEASSVKLIDFGFSADQVSAELAAAERLAGTFLYSAPENSGVLKRPVDGRSDLYSLGVVLYECATGAPPFRAADVGELVHQHLTLAPADPRILNPKISPALSSVILKLLAKDPDDRYQSGRGLRSDLTRLPELVKLDTGSELLEKTPLFGREREMALLAGCLESHHGSIALIEGEPGSGKSRIVQEIQRSARQKGALILAGKASKSDPMLLSALRDSVERAAARSESAAQVFREAGRNSASLLKRFAPALFADAPDFPIGADQDQFFAAIAGFFRHLGSAQSPVVLALDDVQWLDEASLGIIRRIADGTLQNTSLLILCTGRSDPASREGLEKFVSSAGNALSQRIPLGALSEDAASRLIAAHLGGNPVDASFARQLV
ncbi:MAG: serine/threonine-protein kinase, partial [Bdellovibrionota bacterium]